MNQAVNITKRIDTPDGRRFCQVVLASNGRIKPDWIVVNGKEERHIEGRYYIDWNENGKRVRVSVGKNAAEAGAIAQQKNAELNAKGHGLILSTSTTTRRSLSNAIAEYLEGVRLKHVVNKGHDHGRHNTLGCYTVALKYFAESCHKINLEQIDRYDMLKYAAYLVEEKQHCPRTVYNKFEIVMSFLKAQGIRGLVSKTDWPRYTEEEPEIYEQDELDALFAVCESEEKLWFEYFLYSGEREQEVMFSFWSDVNLNSNTVRVTHKPKYGWSPKAYKEREIPIPKKFRDALYDWKKLSDPKSPFIFPTSGGKPKADFLDCLKSVSGRTKLDNRFFLHKFRATFATRHLAAGVDLRTVQLWLGHSDIESTMRYLKPSRSKAVHEQVNSTWS